ncbi:MAG: hypothetical protein V2I27_07370 [Erythrobacter sp.]|nr:hypothetical protein [Erythrobacter sp.]
MVTSGHGARRARGGEEDEVAGSTRSARDRLVTALLIDAVSHRRACGRKTTLRDLHTLLGVPQPVALRVLRRLENEGVARVEPDLADAFASEIHISEAILDGLEEARRKCASEED